MLSPTRRRLFPPDSGQAVALRRRRLRHPVAALADPGQLAGLPLRPGARMPRARRRSAPTSSSTSSPSTRPTPACGPTGSSARSRRPTTAWSCWSACSPTSSPARSTSRGRCARGHHRRHRRLPRLRHARHAAGHRGQRAARRWTWAASSSPARPRRAGSTACCIDAADGELQPVYNFMNDLPGIEHVPTPHLPAEVVKRTFGANTSFDAGRGCPFQCSFCTIINVQGRKSRRRSPDDVERIVRENVAQGMLQLLHHRRQFRPQQGLGGDLRPADPAAREREDQHPADHPGRHALPPAAELHREGGAGRRARACSSGWRTSPPTT